jgi:hypothetical protein
MAKHVAKLACSRSAQGPFIYVVPIQECVAADAIVPHPLPP